MRINLKAQNLSEYSVCLALVLAACLGMQVYVKRGVQARYKAGVDSAIQAIADQAGKDVPTQYEPYYRNELPFTTQTSSSLHEDMYHGGKLDKDIELSQTTPERTSIEGINCYDGK